MKPTFLFLGGDLRVLYAAESLNREYDCFAYGFEGLNSSFQIPILREIQRCSNVVLPLPSSVDGEYINAPYSSEKIKLSDILEGCAPGGSVYAGRVFPKLAELCKLNNLTLIDYLEREELAVMNAVPTAEGALEIALRESYRTIFGSEVLITGMGRIAKVLVRQLTALSANVTVAARKHADLAWARIMGANSVSTNAMDSLLPKFDIIFNTVPATLFSRERLLLLKDDCLLIDLASKSSVEDFELARSAGVRAIWALSLPGKAAPVTAGEIIANTIKNIIEEGEVAQHG